MSVTIKDTAIVLRVLPNTVPSAANPSYVNVEIDGSYVKAMREFPKELRIAALESLARELNAAMEKLKDSFQV